MDEMERAKAAKRKMRRTKMKEDRITGDQNE